MAKQIPLKKAGEREEGVERGEGVGSSPAEKFLPSHSNRRQRRHFFRPCSLCLTLSPLTLCPFVDASLRAQLQFYRLRERERKRERERERRREREREEKFDTLVFSLFFDGNGRRAKEDWPAKEVGRMPSRTRTHKHARTHAHTHTRTHLALHTFFLSLSLFLSLIFSFTPAH